MKAIFVDTLYWVAVIMPDDPWKKSAKRARKSLGDVRLVTTDEVLAEFLTMLREAGPVLREKAAETVRAILKNPNVTVIAQSRDTFLRALDHYAERKDKEYSLTDCASMSAMAADGIREALTNDHHFEQEGYVALIKK